MRVTVPVLLTAIALAKSTGAQGVCHPPEESSDARLLAFFAVPTAFSPGGNAGHLAPGSVVLSFDVTYVPTPAENIRNSSACQSKGENTELSSVFPRPRLAIGLPGGLYVEGSYLPPVTIMDATPNLASLAVGWTRLLRGKAGAPREIWLTLRAHTTFGTVKGPITCSKGALQQRSSNEVCFGRVQSEDTYKPTMFGGEGLLAYSLTAHVSCYAGGGYTSLKPRFQVGFQPTNGTFDDTKIEVDLKRVSAFLGGRYRIGSRGALTGELYSVPKDVTTFRVGASYAFLGAS